MVTISEYFDKVYIITIPDSVTSIGDQAFQRCASLTSITIPAGVTSISEWVFAECSSLTSVTIPTGVTSIGTRAFVECSSLTSITIPASVTSISEWVFTGYYTSNLIVTCLAVTPPSFGQKVFGDWGISQIKVPAARVTAYKAASGWSDFADKISAIN